MGARRKSREMALQALYAMDLTGAWESPPRAFLHEPERWPSSTLFAQKILEGVLGRRHEIDQAIGTSAQHWSLNRMNVVERNILRIATYEILWNEEVPSKVSINEALELAKAYGAPESRRFLNGILDRLARGGVEKQG